jgi:hypothetical protein
MPPITTTRSQTLPNFFNLKQKVNGYVFAKSVVSVFIARTNAIVLTKKIPFLTDHRKAPKIVHIVTNTAQTFTNINAGIQHAKHALNLLNKVLIYFHTAA